MSETLISTGDIRQDYDTIDIVFAAQTVRSWWVRSGGRETLKFLEELNEKLKQAAVEKGCDAVIWVDYDFQREREVQVITAYGTGVKIKK